MALAAGPHEAYADLLTGQAQDTVARKSSTGIRSFPSRGPYKIYKSVQKPYPSALSLIYLFFSLM
jgi:hypothetical protein